MDGFVLGKTFHCKELGVLKVGEDEGRSFFFDIGVHWHELTRKQQRHCMFLTRNIHKLPFGVSRGTNAFPLSDLNAIVKCFYDSVKSSHLSTIACNGGHFERDLLQHLQIPSINLEHFGCPKAEFLFDRLVWLETCGTILAHIPTSIVQRLKSKHLENGYATEKLLSCKVKESNNNEKTKKTGSFKNHQMVKEYKRVQCFMFIYS